MKKLFILILVLPFISWAQEDFVYLENDSLNLTKQLKGKVPGLIVEFPILSPAMMQPDRFPSSQESNEPSIVYFRCRMPSLVLQNSNPLYIIDGIPSYKILSMDEIDSNEISSVTVLKDASATALYGSRGRNGVIIIKTKKYQEELDAKETTYDLAVLDLGYESFLKTQPSAETYSLNYLQNKNQRYVSIWNQKVLTGNPEIYEMQIDYDSKTYYGLDFEYKLYMFFKFIEHKHKISFNG